MIARIARRDAWREHARDALVAKLRRTWRWPRATLVENAGRAVSWAVLTGSLAGMIQWNFPDRRLLRLAVRPTFTGFYLLVNALGRLLDWAERRVVP
jgi:hypothetical protein